jgi:ammonium transporter Rh
MNTHARSLSVHILSAAALVVLLFAGTAAAASGPDPAPTVGAMEHVQKYERAIHIMAMLLVGFGFLMVFVKRYGRSALTATYLLVAAAVPLYFLLDAGDAFGQASKPTVDRLLTAEFAAASLLICAGAVLGRLKMWQYIVLAMLFVPAYMANEWLVTGGGLPALPAGQFLDTGGSIIIHAFGAFFGLGVLLTMTTRAEYDVPVESNATSDRFSLLGSMVLWVFWPSFCAAMVTPAEVPHTAVNVVLALCGSTLATYFATVGLRRQISPADIANATLAGGVAIGALCARPDFFAGAFILGLLAGTLSTFGFAVIQPRLQNAIKKIDTCGVLYLHGLPGLLGGLAAVVFIDTRDVQLLGIGITVGLALAGGFVGGKVLAVFGRRQEAYVDHEELIVEAEPGEAK